MVKFKIEYPKDWSKQKFYIDGQIIDIELENAEYYQGVLKIGTIQEEVKK